MSKTEMWYQQYRCRNCGEKFTQFPALLGCARMHGVKLLRQPHHPDNPDLASKQGHSKETQESESWVKTHELHPCSATENGIADLIGFSIDPPKVGEGSKRGLRDDEISNHLRH